MIDQNMQTILCDNCGTLNSDYNQWCRFCGEPLSDDSIRILPPGTSLDHGRFTITTFLGHGGSALTYRAKQKNFTTEVAVKEFYPTGIARRNRDGYTVGPIRPDLELDYEQGRQQFMNAGNTLHSLSNISNIVSVHDAFTDNETAYIIEDYIDGASLYDLIREKKRFTYNEAVEFIQPIMKALIKVHEYGIIHRDINPSNIMVSEGTAYLIDFGIARPIRNRTTRSKYYKNEEENESDSYTRGYAAPEQITGSAQEAAWTDVYGIAATLYHMITGNEPDDARSRIVSDLMPPADTVSDVTALQSKVIMQGMELNTVVRYQNMRAFLNALISCMNDERASEPSSKAEPKEVTEENREKHPVILFKSAIILLLCILVGIAGYKWDSIKEIGLFKDSNSSESGEDTPAEGNNSADEEGTASVSTEEEAEQINPTEDAGSAEESVQKAEKCHLRADIGVSGDLRIDGEPSINTYVFGNTFYKREDIEYVTFINSLEEKPGNAWDVSEDKNGEVYAWVDGGHLYIGADGIISLPQDCTGLFSYYTNVKQISFGTGVDTSNVKNMRFMFKQDMMLMSLDLSNFDTSNVESMDRMFTQCRAITSLDLSSFDTSNNKNMTAMFAHCYTLTDINVSSFNTSTVTDMAYIFYNCKSIQEIDIRSFDTSLVTSGKCMFLNCERLRNLYFDVYKFRTGNMTNMHAMFSNCSSLLSLDVSHFDTSRVTDMEYMFNNDASLTALAYRNFDMSRVENKGDMLTGTIWE